IASDVPIEASQAGDLFRPPELLLALHELPVGGRKLGRALLDFVLEIVACPAECLLRLLRRGDVANEAGEHRRTWNGNLSDGDCGGKLDPVGTQAGHVYAPAQNPSLSRAKESLDTSSMGLAQRRRNEERGHLFAFDVGLPISKRSFRRRVELAD